MTMDHIMYAYIIFNALYCNAIVHVGFSQIRLKKPQSGTPFQESGQSTFRLQGLICTKVLEEQFQVDLQKGEVKMSDLSITSK